MASTRSISLLPLPRFHNHNSIPAAASPPRTAALAGGRRQCIFLLTASTALKAVESPASAQDIPLFGLRKKIEKAEEEAVEVVKEGLQAAEMGVETAEKGIEGAVGFSGLAQAAVVAAAEVVAVVVATSVVNGILGPDAQKS